ncbi:MAG: nucleotide sugar dehydrogenase, partial [Coriobacteriia bacterium]|nr:nucleotide sugar dehydrogenase [Coriobacteriia bacterium]
MNIAIAGLGYVGLPLAVLLAQNNTVYALDIHQSKVDLINKRISPIGDSMLPQFLEEQKLDLHATTDPKLAYSQADILVIATPTDYRSESDSFDTSSIESVLTIAYEHNPNLAVFIKSTIPIGYIEELRARYNKEAIYFSPEFLREGKALYDNLHPSRIIVGGKTEICKTFAQLLKDVAVDDVPILLMDSHEAEAVKLFANSYLATRVAFFNELDTYCEVHGLNTRDVIEGVSLDSRIGDFYNNPSFGYGGYCLPKDT